MHSKTCRGRLVSGPARPALLARVAVIALATAGVLLSGLALRAAAAAEPSDERASAGTPVVPVPASEQMSPVMKQMLSQSSTGLVIVPRKSGMLSMSLGGHFMSAMRARLDAHGNVILSCEDHAAAPAAAGAPAAPAAAAAALPPASPATAAAGATSSGHKE